MYKYVNNDIYIIFLIFWHIWAINIQSVGRTKTSTKHHEFTNVSSWGIIERQIYLWLANGRALLPASRGCGSKAMENYQHWYNLIICNLYRHLTTTGRMNRRKQTPSFGFLPSVRSEHLWQNMTTSSKRS